MEELTAKQLRDKIATGQVSSVEVTAAVFEWIRKFEPVIRYIGYVGSGEEFVALILYNGEPMAVASGDPIGEGQSISRITREKIVIAGPEGRIREVPVEGDER